MTLAWSAIALIAVALMLRVQQARRLKSAVPISLTEATLLAIFLLLLDVWRQGNL